MDNTRLYSIMLEFQVSDETIIPFTTGHLVHALFFSLIKQCDENLFSLFHNEPGPRPFTLSSLVGGRVQEHYRVLRKDASCFFRLTLFDSKCLWDRLRTQFLESGPMIVRLGTTELRLMRMVSTPSPSAPKWVGSTDWRALAILPPHHAITLHFVSPTAFSQGDRQFDLLPKPHLIWGSLLRIWNRYAPEDFQVEKNGMDQSFSNQEVVVTACDVQTKILHFPNHLQKGFTGTCTYHLQSDDRLVARLTRLAAFAFYAGIGYKTTMGMGQVRPDFGEER